jgi:hypothetical protein
MREPVCKRSGVIAKEWIYEFAALCGRVGSCRDLPASSWIRIVLGVVTAAVGTLTLLGALNIIPSRAPHAGDAPAWIGAAIGLAFFLAGIVSIVNGLAGAGDSSGELSATAPRPVRDIYKAMGAVITVLLAVLLTWVAFGPGERSFSVSGGDAMLVGVSSGGQIKGRVAFGLVAILAWFFVGGVMVLKARRWFQRR